MCARVCVHNSGYGGFIQDVAWPPVVNADPIGHDAQSAAEILNENSCTHSSQSDPAGLPALYIKMLPLHQRSDLSLLF